MAFRLFALLVLVTASTTTAQPLFEFRNGDGLVPEPWSPDDDPLTIVASDLTFLGPLAGRVGELTGTPAVIAEGLDFFLDGIADDFECDSSELYVVEPGVLRIYDVPAFPGPWPFCPFTYGLGTLLLELTISDIDMWVTLAQCDSRFFGSFQVTGGEWFDSVSNDGVGWSGEFDGTADRSLADPAVCDLDFELSFHPLAILAARFDASSAVPTEKVSWGRVKAEYD